MFYSYSKNYVDNCIFYDTKDGIEYNCKVSNVSSTFS